MFIQGKADTQVPGPVDSNPGGLMTFMEPYSNQIS